MLQLCVLLMSNVSDQPSGMTSRALVFGAVMSFGFAHADLFAFRWDGMMALNSTQRANSVVPIIMLGTTYRDDITCTRHDCLFSFLVTYVLYTNENTIIRRKIGIEWIEHTTERIFVPVCR